MPCPRLPTYPPAMQQQAADALDALPPGHALAAMTEDHGELRARIRAACGR